MALRSFDARLPTRRTKVWVVYEEHKTSHVRPRQHAPPHPCHRRAPSPSTVRGGLTLATSAVSISYDIGKLRVNGFPNNSRLHRNARLLTVAPREPRGCHHCLQADLGPPRASSLGFWRSGALMAQARHYKRASRRVQPQIKFPRFAYLPRLHLNDLTTLHHLISISPTFSPSLHPWKAVVDVLYDTSPCYRRGGVFSITQSGISTTLP